ncbi:RtcB family protein [Thauera sp. CAU 1555]|uniref:3'-phosphate/5'-hydroxy nucleic acid ligase n=1 Tax=Thauera sedimentorum TaxID=2767595 RepID=A0ABR9B8T9_9RHOO|nr:RtcB family protein [Thauera sedimentorum]MBC9071854.1 RtcB family protein [Thauera sedimentorum]MBD8502773.1 RtcB family protein [Thauera sedimentorum]
MPIRQELHSPNVPVRIWTDDIDEGSKAQLANIASLPFVHHHVAAMPDVHLGIGATIGSVIATHQAIIPAAVGVDIGCGMVAARLSLTANDIDEKRLRKVFDQITRDVPVGRAQHDDNRVLVEAVRPFEPGLKALTERHPQLLKTFGKFSRWANQMGTLGGGNHFIEVCLDEANQVWVMLHSGSRGIGNAIASYFIELARKDMARHMIQLPDRDLAYFREGSEYFADYVEAVHWAQAYAMANRQAMLDLVLAGLARHLPAFSVTTEAVNCHHNYVAREHHFGADVWVTRKGAIRAGQGDLGIVPGSMGACSYIVRGKGNPESFCSSAHGAGRRMSRTAATKRFTEADLARQTEGVICRKDKGVVDEIPGAYKDIDEVMANQRDLTEILHTLKQVVCVKG